MQLSLEAPLRKRAHNVWHELAHAGQDVPYAKSPKAGRLVLHWKDLERAAAKAGVSRQDFYWSFDPLEKHARDVAESVVGEVGKRGRISPQRYDEIFEYFLDKAIAGAEEAEVMFGK